MGEQSLTGKLTVFQGDNHFTVETKSLAIGTYFLQLTYGHETSTIKILKTD